MSNTQRMRAAVSRGVIGATLIAGLATVARVAMADPPVATAPLRGAASPADLQDVAPPDASGMARVFPFTDVPANQHVPLIRAVFDQGGYQLFDTAGETIVVPFADRNLYVMKFAVSPNDAMYFVNDDGTPILYVPRNGYLENATVPGAKWYPFSETFHPTSPVFLGIAPSYTEFVDTNWYPETALYGGYYGARPFATGGLFVPSPGLTLYFGTRPYYSWRDYRQYVIVPLSPYRFGYANRPIYSVGSRPRNGQIFLGCVPYPNSPSRPRNGSPFANGGTIYYGDRDGSSVRDDHSNWGNHGIRDRDDTGNTGARFTGKPNFLDSRDRAPGPVFDRPSGGRPGESRPGGNRPMGSRPNDTPIGRPGMTNGPRPDGNRRDGGRTPGGTRRGASSSKRSGQ